MPDNQLRNVGNGRITTLREFLESAVMSTIASSVASEYPTATALSPPTNYDIAARIAARRQQIIAAGGFPEDEIQRAYDTHVRYTVRQNNIRTGACLEHETEMRTRLEHFMEMLAKTRNYVDCDEARDRIDEYQELIDDRICVHCPPHTPLPPEPIKTYDEFRTWFVRSHSTDAVLSAFDDHITSMEWPAIEIWRKEAAVANAILEAARKAGVE